MNWSEYDELIKRLRKIHPEEFGDAWDFAFACQQSMHEAADAIEELQQIATHYEEESKGWWLAARDAKEERERLKEQIPRWIPVTERLPKGADNSGELCENAWLLFDDGNVYPGWMNGITEKVYYIDNRNDFIVESPISRVKMWQPKPEPPKGEWHECAD